MSQQFQRSLSTFILPGSPYQLNLPASTINNLLAIAPQQYVTADSIRNNGVHNGVHHAVLPAIIVSKNQVTESEDLFLFYKLIISNTFLSAQRKCIKICKKITC